MAKNTVYIDVIIDDKGTTKKVAIESKKLAAALDDNTEASVKNYRAQQGLAQNTANRTKAFAKHARGINGFLSLYATWAANVFAVSAAFQFLKDASDITNLIAGQEALTQTTGVAYKTLTNNIREATDGQLSYAEAARAAAIGSAAGLTSSQLIKLGQGAKNASIVLGRDLTDSFNRLIRGVTKAEPELLDELGIILRLEDATKRYADALNLNAEDLTTYERTQAVTNEVLRQTEEKFAKIQEVMDPSAASLNRFLVSFDNLINSLKQGLIQKLRPVFDALAGNTNALLAGLTLVSYYMIRNLLPDFGALGAAAEESSKKQKAALAGVRAEAEKAKTEFKQLGLTKKEALEVESRKARGALSGIDTSKAKRESGISFLTGASETAKAAANAEKIIANAEAQTRSGAAVTTGVLKGLTQQQVADLRTAYAQKKLIITDFETKHTSVMVRLGLQWKVYQTTAIAALASVRSAFTVFGAFLAKWGSRVLATLGWVGVLYTVGSIAYDIYKSFDPAAKAIEESNKKTENFVSNIQTLNEELTASFNAQKLGVETTTESLVRLGNAFASADIVNKIIAFNELDPKSEAYDEARIGLQQTLDVLSKFEPAVLKYADALRNATKGERLEVPGLADIEKKAIETATAIKTIPEGIKKVDQELKNLIGTGKGLDPTINLRENLEALIKDLEIKQKGLKESAGKDPINNEQTQKLVSINDRLAIQQARLLKMQTALKEESESIFGISERNQELRERDIAIQEEVVAGLQEQRIEQIGIVEARARGIELAKEEIAAGEKTLKYYKELNNQMSGISEKLTGNAAAADAARERAAAGQTLGITTEQRLINLDLQREEATARRLELLNKIEAASASQRAGQLEGNADQIATADRALAAANSELRILDAQQALEERNIQIQRDKLLFEEKILKLKTDQLNKSTAVSAIEQQIKDIQSGAAGVYGIEAERKILELTKLLNEANLVLAKARVKEARFALGTAQTNLTGGTGSEADVFAAQKELADARAALASARGQVGSYQNIGGSILGQVKDDTRKLEEQAAALSMNPALQRYRETLISLGAEGEKLSETERQSLYAEIQAQEELTRTTEMRAGLMDSINSNMTSAFTSLIDGTKSLKQAFGDMAISILRDLAAMIAKALIFKAIQAALPGMGEGGGFFASLLGMANGGVLDGGFRAFANGGTVSSPTLGLVGEGRYNEAIVPLPDGRSIPVVMQGAGQQQNNVVVNVSMNENGNGKATTSGASSNQAEGLGKAIAAAVQKEIQNQKRAGGMLNSYGAA